MPPIAAPALSLGEKKENTQRYSEKSSPKQQTQRILKASSPPLVRESTDFGNDYMEVQPSPKGKGAQ